MYVTIVIGAGFAGTLAALELAKEHRVLLIEAGPRVIPPSSSSYNECYKLHIGMHYLGDLKTAEYCLVNAIEFAKKYFDFVAGKEDIHGPWRRGRHYVVSASLVSPDGARLIAKHLSALYRTAVDEDPSKKVFGEPKDFINVLDLCEYSFISQNIPYRDAQANIQQTHVALGFETAESQIDIDTLRQHLQEQIDSNPNITFMPNTWVSNITFDSSKFGYQITAKQRGKPDVVFAAKTVVNCAWQNIEVLDKKIGNFTPSEYAVNRIKVSLLVKLPEALRDLNTSTFLSGPFFSITTLPDGQAILTSERLTNIGHFEIGSEIPEDLKATLLKLTPDSPEGRKIAQEIIEDCAGCFKEPHKSIFLQTKLTDIHVGFVKMLYSDEKYTEESLHKKDSAIHSRHIDGVQHKSLGYIANSGMKMTFTLGNAVKVNQLITAELPLIERYEAMVALIKDELGHEFLQTHKHTINSILYITWREPIVAVLKASPEFTLAEKARSFTVEILNAVKARGNLVSKLKEGFFASEPQVSSLKKSEHLTGVTIIC